MSLFPASAIPSSAATGYDIDNSLRFNKADSPYLNRTPSGSPTNAKKYTVSVWLKPSSHSNETYKIIYSTSGGGDNEDYFAFYDDGTDSGESTIRIGWEKDGTSGQGWGRRSYRVFRDRSAWYHFVLAWDSTQSTAADRLKVYCNNELVSPWRVDIAEGRDPGSNQDFHWNSTDGHKIGGWRVATAHWDGYMAEFHNVDGQALAPSDFGEKGDYGEWKPIEYAGTYGNNGFYLDFKTAGTGTTGAGKDVSGKGNHWATSGISSTDQMLDTPTNNFCTLNPLDWWQYVGYGTMREGNLQLYQTDASYWNDAAGTMAMRTGKWYWEYAVLGTYSSGATLPYHGVMREDTYMSGSTTPSVVGSYGYYRTGNDKYENGSSVVWTYSFTVGDIMQVAYDADTGKLWYGKNNSWVASGNPASGTNQASTVNGYSSYGYKPIMTSRGSGSNTGTPVVNFGQDSSFAGNKTAQGKQDSNSIGDFYYTPPTGFLSLCTKNLPDPTVIPSEHFNTITYMGNGASTRSLTGVGFQPDFLWIKGQNLSWNHHLYDAVRGVGENKALYLNNYKAEGADASSSTTYGYVSSLDTDGFTGTYTGSFNYTWNQNAQPYVVWNWKAGTSTSGTTSGSGTGQSYSASYNADAGFSIIKFGGNGTAGHQIYHHLGAVPEFFVVKGMTDDNGNGNAGNWQSYHIGYHASSPEDYHINMNSTQAVQDSNTRWNDTAPTSSVITLGADWEINNNNADFICYAFRSIDGYSKVGSYRGNSSADGPFVYCGFRPAYILLKESTASGENWQIYDNKRDEYNPSWTTLATNNNLGQTSGSGYDLDMISSGFKIRYNNNQFNDSSSDYIFIAFAESPFKHTNAR